MKHVTVIDYGIGNLLSVRRALEFCGAEVTLSHEPRQIMQAERLLLPGVGAFASGMNALHRRWLVPAILQYATQERPFLGICLGMQMMLESSEEFGTHQGLGLIPGTVTAIPRVGPDGAPHTIPHIGWNALLPPEGRVGWPPGLLQGVADPAYVYFVHSYAAQPSNPDHRLADCHYHGLTLSAAIQRDHLFGCQFHPEKSGAIGLGMIRNFLNI